MSEVDIVIVNWNGGALIRACVESVKEAVSQMPLTVNIIVVDNASTDKSAEELHPNICRLSVVKNSRNIGFAAACNQGARMGRGKYLLFLNPDTKLSVASLRAPFEFLENPMHSEYGACGVQLKEPNGTVSRSCARFPSSMQLLGVSLGLAQMFPGRAWGIAMTNWAHDESRDVDHIIGAFYFVRRGLFETLGGFDERFFVYLEDLDLSLRIHHSGRRIRYLDSAVAEHIGGGTSRRAPVLRLYYSVGSRIAFIRKHYPRADATALVLVALYIEPCIRAIQAIGALRLGALRTILAAFTMIWRSEVTVSGTPLHSEH